MPTAAAKAAIDPSEEDYFWDVQPHTSLYNYITTRQWSKALSRLKIEPDEASVLILKRAHGKRGDITEKVLPLHKVLEVDLVEDARRLDVPPAENGGKVPTMDGRQMELISELIRVHPDGTKLTDHEGRLPLHLVGYSSMSPPASIIEQLIDAYPAATNRTDGKDRLPIHAACMAPISTSEVIEVLIKSNPNTVSMISEKDGGLPLHYAAWGGGRRPEDVAKIVAMLVEAYPEGLRVKDGDGDVPLTIMVKYGRTSTEAFRYILEADVEALDYVVGGESSDSGNYDHAAAAAVPGKGDTILHSAVSMAPHGQTEAMVRALLDVRPTLSTVSNARGQLPLHSALDHYGATLPIIDMLLKANPAAVEVKDTWRERLPLHYACKEGAADADVAKLLIEAFPEGLSMKDSSDSLPLHLALNAIPTGAPSSKDKGIDLTHIADQVAHMVLMERTDSASILDPDSDLLPLHVAISKNKPPFLVEEILAAHEDAAIELVGQGEKVSALHILAMVRDQYRPEEVNEIASALLDARPECAKLKDGLGRLPLHAASDAAEKDTKRNQRTKTKKKPKISSGEVLVDKLLSAYPEAVQERDNDGNLPLHYSIAAFDAGTTKQLLDSYEEGAKDTGLLPLHIACGSLKSPYEQYEASPDAVDEILKRLLAIYPDAASIENKDGLFPLTILSKMPNILQHVKEETFQALIDAYPKAAKAKDKEGDYPVHNIIRNLHYSDNPELNLAFTRSLLVANPGAAKEKDGRGNLALDQALSHAQGTEKHCKSSSILGEIARLLFDAYPDAATFADRAGHYPLHHVARIIGQTAGSSKRAPYWAQLFRDIMQQDESILEKLDDRGRSPLHALCFHLGDAAVDNEDGIEYERSPEFDDIVREMLSRSSAVLRLEDSDGQAPLNMLNRELGRGSDTLSTMLSFVQDEINKAKKNVTKVVAKQEEDAEADKDDSIMKDEASNEEVKDTNRDEL